MFVVPDESEKLHIVEVGEEDNDTIDQNDTVLEMESSEEEVTNCGPEQSIESRAHRQKKKSEAELLKTSLYNDLGLYFNDVMKGKFEAHEPPKDLHVDHISRERRNIIWVNPLFPTESQYNPMAEQDRNPFIRKVFGIVCFNLSIIVLFQLLVINIDLFNEFFQGIIGLILGIVGSLFMMTASYIIMYEYGKSCPCSGIAWVLTVVGGCLACATLIAKAQLMEVVIAFIATIAVVILCIGLACTKFDFTKYYIYLMVFGLVVMVFGIASMILRIVLNMRLHVLKMVLCCLTALFYSVSLIMEIQMIIGGYTLEIEPTEYIYGSVTITISIIYLFITILRIVTGIGEGGD